jgi:hypothetical protein
MLEDVNLEIEKNLMNLGEEFNTMEENMALKTIEI